MTRRERLVVAGALLLGAAVAFPAGMMFGGEGPADQPPPEASPGASARAVYSPEVLRDPWFRERQRENVEALESYCRQSGKLCAEARQARRSIEETP